MTQSHGQSESNLPRFERLGEFRIIRRLGHGGMAEVFLAEQESLRRQVAIKVLRSDLLTGSDDTMLQRFQQEAAAAAGLAHPHIVQVYMIGEHENVHYIAQEYVNGPNLKEYLRKQGSPTVRTGLRIMKQVAAALQVASEAGIVHRDIKPENILMTRKGEVKVADFGLARLVRRADADVNLTQVGTTMGTPLYMSPEQISGSELDHRSDIYSFGVTCYHLFAGRPPFMADNSMGLALKHMNQKPRPLSDYRADLPIALCQVIHKMMAKEVDSRYTDAKTLLKDIRQIIRAIKDGTEAEVSAADVSDFQTTTAPANPKQLSPARLVWLMIGTCVLAGVVSAVMGWLLRAPNLIDEMLSR